MILPPGGVAAVEHGQLPNVYAGVRPDTNSVDYGSMLGFTASDLPDNGGGGVFSNPNPFAGSGFHPPPMPGGYEPAVQIPCDLNAERIVMSALMVQTKHWLPLCRKFADGRYLYSPLHNELFTLIAKMHDHNVDVNQSTLAAWIEAEGGPDLRQWPQEEIDAVAGLLAEHGAGAAEHALGRIVKLAAARQQVNVARDIIRRAAAEAESPSFVSVMAAKMGEAADMMTDGIELDPQPVTADAEVDLLPEFPLETLPRVYRDIAMAVADDTGSTPGAIALTMLGLISTCIPGKARIHVPGFKADQPVSLYLMSALPSGMRKTTQIRALHYPIVEHQEDLTNQHKRKMGDYEEAMADLKQALKDAKKTGESVGDINKQIAELEPPRPKDLFVTSATPEALSMMLERNGGWGSVLDSESAFLRQVDGAYGPNAGSRDEKGSGSPDVDVWLGSYMGDPTRILRAGNNKNLYLPNPLMSVYSITQPVNLGKMRNPQYLADRGLWARFLFGFPRDVSFRPLVARSEPCFTPALQNEWARLLHALLHIPHNYHKKSNVLEPEKIHMSQEAYQTIIDYYNDTFPRFKSGDLKNYVEWGNRLLGHTLRLAAILHMMQNAHDLQWMAYKVSNNVALCAVRMMSEFFVPHSLYAHKVLGVAEADASDAAAQTLEWMVRTARTAENGVVTHDRYRDYLKQFPAVRPWDITRILTNTHNIRPIFDPNKKRAPNGMMPPPVGYVINKKTLHPRANR